MVSTYPLQQQLNMATQARCTYCTCDSCSGTLAPLHLVLVESIVQSPELVQVDLPQCPERSDTPETSCDPTEKNRVALNPAIVETMQSAASAYNLCPKHRLR